MPGSTQIAIVSDAAALRAMTKTMRAKGARIALVPTMGALHKGHMSLVEEALKRADCVIATIFVNPAQFAANEDFSKYPRSFEADLQKLAAAGASACFAPTPDIMYPSGFCTQISLDGPAKAELEDRFRPSHFAGVALVVAKLLNLAQADVAIFGEKDYQQLKVIERMARDLDIPTHIYGAPTLRELDGLALSSRNIYLSVDERARAPAIYTALTQAAEEIRADAPMKTVLRQAQAQLGERGFHVDYFEARNADTLAPAASRADAPLRLLTAARLGATRLIDNLAV